MSLVEKFDKLVQRFDFLETTLASGQVDNIKETSREYSALKPIVDKILIYHKICTEITEAEEMLSEPSMSELANRELEELNLKLKAIEKEIRIALIPCDQDDARPVILEIRPGTGGEEAALFAGNLIRMYQRYAELHRWKFTIIDQQITEIGGTREVIANIAGKNVYARLKYESGVHRVQRIPVTESGGRIHTSAATVAVLPEAKDVDIAIPENDIRIDTMRASGAGGQHVNTTDSAVRITHIPSGIIVTSSEKSQHRNREIAMNVLRARLYDLERQKQQNMRAQKRKSQIGTGDRSERIRTYNFPQGRLSDHRINLTLYKLDQIMEGNLDEIIDALSAHDQMEKLANFDDNNL